MKDGFWCLSVSETGHGLTSLTFFYFYQSLYEVYTAVSNAEDCEWRYTKWACRVSGPSFFFFFLVHKELAAPLRPCGERVGALTLFLLNHSHSDPFSPFGFTRVP